MLINIDRKGYEECKAKVKFQTGLTGCVLSYDHVHSIMPGFGIDERRYIPVTEFVAQSNGSTHRKVCEERKAQTQKSLNSEEIIRTGTRIYTDPGAQRLEKAPEHGGAMIGFFFKEQRSEGFENHS